MLNQGFSVTDEEIKSFVCKKQIQKYPPPTGLPTFHQKQAESPVAKMPVAIFSCRITRKSPGYFVNKPIINVLMVV
jgi:hypothetical protein